MKKQNTQQPEAINIEEVVGKSEAFILKYKMQIILAIAAIVVASVVVAGAAGFAIFWFVVQKKSFAALVEMIKGGNAAPAAEEAPKSEEEAPKTEEELAFDDAETSKQWYIGDNTITKVVIPEGVEKINSYAFANLTALAALLTKGHRESADLLKRNVH